MAATYVLPTTTMAAAITADATSIKLASVANVTAGCWLVSNSEAMLVTGVFPNETPYPRVTVIRGQGGSVATAQIISTTVYIGTPDKFYQRNPVGTPPSPALVEPYINTSLADGGVSFWTTNSGGTAWIPSPGATGGAVTGPASSTDGALAVWNGTTGTVLKNGTAALYQAQGIVLASKLKQTLVTGGAAGNFTVTGIATADQLVSVIYYIGAGVAVTDLSNLTTEFTISAANTINNTGGTDSTGGKLLVTWVDLT